MLERFSLSLFVHIITLACFYSSAGKKQEIWTKGLRFEMTVTEGKVWAAFFCTVVICKYLAEIYILWTKGKFRRKNNYILGPWMRRKIWPKYLLWPHSKGKGFYSPLSSPSQGCVAESSQYLAVAQYNILFLIPPPRWIWRKVFCFRHT